MNKISDNTTESGNIAIRAIIKRLVVFNKDIFETLVEMIKQKPTTLLTGINKRRHSQMLLKKTMKLSAQICQKKSAARLKLDKLNARYAANNIRLKPKNSLKTLSNNMLRYCN